MIGFKATRLPLLAVTDTTAPEGRPEVWGPSATEDKAARATGRQAVRHSSPFR
jgi:hypothetical protein